MKRIKLEVLVDDENANDTLIFLQGIILKDIYEYHLYMVEHSLFCPFNQLEGETGECDG